MQEDKLIQKKFHINVDTERFYNRINNPFIVVKERKLSILIAKQVPEGGKYFLEIGCGEGSNHFFLREFLPKIKFVGIDFSLKKILFWKNFFTNANGICCDAINIPLKEHSVDVILCRDLLHHIAWGKDNVLSEAVRVLKPNGVILILESNGRSLLSRIFQWIVPAERGMIDSTSENLLSLGSKFGATQIEYVEASFLIRALGYILGWPGGIKQYLFYPVYLFVWALEIFFECLTPQHKYMYMMTKIKPNK